MEAKNKGRKAEVFDAFDMILQTTINGEEKNIRNISDTTKYNIASKAQWDIRLIYIVLNDYTDIRIISDKNNKINLKVE